MKKLLYKVLGISLLAAATIGIIVSLAGLILILRVQTQVAESLTGMLDLLDRTLETTEHGFAMADSALADATSALESLQTTVDSVETWVDKTLPTLESISSLLGSKLPDTIRSTRSALTSAQTAAKNVDTFLTTLSKIPFIGPVIYNPETPLYKTIGDISDSLKDTPGVLTGSQKGVDQMTESLGNIQNEMGSVSGNVRDITASAVEARRILQDYQKVNSDLHKEVNRLQEKMPLYLRLANIGSILLFAWLALAQIAIAMQGLELLGHGKPAPAATEPD